MINVRLDGEWRLAGLLLATLHPFAFTVRPIVRLGAGGISGDWASRSASVGW